MRATRVLLGVLGVVVGLYGAYLLVSRQDGEQLRSAAVWLAAGVVLHDGLIAFAVLGLVALVVRFVPLAARAPTLVAVVILGPLTLIAVPMLGRFGAKADNPTLLDRDYWLGYGLIVAIVVAGVLVASVLRARRPAPDATVEVHSSPEGTGD